MNRRDTTLALLALGAAPLASLAQQQGKIRRIGFLAARQRSTRANPDVYYDAFVQGMHELGYVEGKNLLIEWRFADQKEERLQALAAELVHLNVEVLVTHGTQAAKAAQTATRTIPIVVTAVTGPVGTGLAASLARPGGNITGLSLTTSDISPKHLELLKIMLPKASRVAALMNPGNAGHPAILKSIHAAAQRAGLKVLPVNARTPEEVERGFALLAGEHAEAAIVLVDSFFIGQRRQIVDLAAKHRVPTLHSYREDVVAGALMSYGQNLADFYRRAANYVDKILKGAKPADLPIEQPTTFHLAVNRKTAKALGLPIPQELLLRVDEVID